jgi:hypothetical protein
MPPVLRLEYTCTEAERIQAKNLSIRQQLGGGSKLRTWLVLLLMVMGVLVAAWFQLRAIPEIYRALAIVAFFGCVFLIAAGKQRWRKSVPAPTALEISEAGVTIPGTDSAVRLLWSGFSRCLESDELFVLVDRTKTTLLILPKRAFLDEKSQTWFREQAANIASTAAPALTELPGAPASAPTDRITLTVHLGLRDYFDRALASWLMWGFWLSLNGVILVALINAPVPPHPVVSAAEVFFWVSSVMAVLTFLMILLVFSVYKWLTDLPYRAPQEIALSEASLEFAGSDGSGTIPWSRFAYYKETFGSFIVWRGWFWMMFPKRAFASQNDVKGCREILNRNLQRSRWFFGL